MRISDWSSDVCSSDLRDGPGGPEAAMTITHELVRSVAAKLYEAALKKVPEDTKDALRRALEAETKDVSRDTLKLMLNSALAAERKDHLACSHSGIPVYFLKLGTNARLGFDIKRALHDGFR